MNDKLLQYLPIPYRKDKATADFLKAFEKVLFGIDDNVGLDSESFPGGIEQSIESLSSYFDPQLTDKDFLSWLASWLAFTLRADLPQAVQRNFIANLSTLYRWRGTAKTLESILYYFTNSPATATPSDTEPHCFYVTIDLSKLTAGNNQAEIDRQLDIANALIAREKPAHTRYILLPIFPSFRVGPVPDEKTDSNTISLSAQVGVNTRLGTAMWEK
jgi:phage tail-like protein